MAATSGWENILLGFDMVIVMERELSSLKEKGVVNRHPK